MIVPTFEEYLNTPARVNCIVSCEKLSMMVLSKILIESGALTLVPMFAKPKSIAVAAVRDFIVDPGS
jgi:hypothetical protein